VFSRLIEPGDAHIAIDGENTVCNAVENGGKVIL
jgi:hypothetical protein